MARIIRGNSNPFLQPGAEIDVDENGLMTGNAAWEGDAALLPLFTPAINVTVHPKNPALVCHHFKVKYAKLGKARVEADFIGLLYDPSIPKVEFAGGSGQDPIETHEKFEEFAGTPEEPLNGAQFDADTGEFLGFFEPGDFQGVRAYIVPSVIVHYSYHTWTAPQVGQVGRIVNTVPNFRKPPTVRNFLLIGMPYRQIGPLYHVTEQYLGSSRKGWNRTIY